MRKWQVWLVQSTLAVAVIGLAGRELARHWEEFRSLDIELTVDVPMLGLATLVVWATYAILIEGWRRVVAGWSQRLSFGSAAHIWCLANMGRYLPGKVWSIAGLAVLARRFGVSGWAATGSALAMQALAVGTGASVVAVAAPEAASPVQLGVAAVIAVSAVWFLVSEQVTSRVVRAIRPDAQWKSLRLRTAAGAGVATLLSWLTYGFAFWVLAHGLIPGVDLSLRAAVGVFTAGYIAGLVAIFAPGGLGVREAVFLAILAPRIGASGALVMAVGSRLLMTVTELAAALLGLLLGRRYREENSVEAS